MTSSTTFELRPDRKLMHPIFQGYKLSLNPLSKVKHSLATAPVRRHASADQYSFLHSKLFSLHNHLVRDPWNHGTVFYVDVNMAVQAVRYTENTGTVDGCVAVLDLPKVDTPKPGAFNLSIHFVSEKFAVLSDGLGSLSLVETGDRYDRGAWKVVYTGRPMPDAEEPWFLIQDARVEMADGRRVFHCVLVSVIKVEDVFKAVLEWVVVEQAHGSDEWSIRLEKRLKGRSLPAYCVLEDKCEALLVSADKSFAVEGAAVNEKEEKPKETVSYGWSQKNEEIIIRFDVDDNDYLDEYKVITEPERLTVQMYNRVLFNADLWGAVNPNLTQWHVENDMFIVTLVKSYVEVADEWECLMKDGSLPASEFLDAEQRVVYPCTDVDDLEDCDYDDKFKGRDFHVARIEAATGWATYKLNVGKNAPLFTTVLRPGQPPAMAQRYDVDVCMWQFPPGGQSGQTQLPKHEGTLAAFGYVQASKQQKKYIQSSCDFNYGVIAEPKRHVFIYKSQHSSAGNLKSRTGAQVLIGQQMLLTMDAPDDEICGLVAETGVLMLLTENELLCVQVDAS